jgi:signal transduction histidine kinase
MLIGNWLRSPRRVVLLSLAATWIPVTALVWLGWRSLETDRVTEERRIQDQRERAADLIVTALDQTLSAAEQRLTDPRTWTQSAAGDAWLVVMSPRGVEIYPEARVAYYPMPAPIPEARAEVFQAADDYELRLQDHGRAIASLRDLVDSPDAAVRAGAQIRLARNLRNVGRPAEALDVYSDLAKNDGAGIDGIPAEVVARRSRCALLAELHRTADLRREAESLNHDLRAARWRLDRAQYEYLLDDVHQWLPVSSEPETSAETNAAAVDWLSEKWEGANRGRVSGREVVRFGSHALTILWRSDGERLAAILAEPDYVEHVWLAALDPLMTSQGVHIAMEDAKGAPVVGASSGGPVARRPASAAVPWTIIAASADPRSDLDSISARRRLILGALGSLVAIAGAGSYFTARALSRELAVARLQSDFVAAVSHEFRTPLAALRQANEHLTDGRVTDVERRQRYYQIQTRSTDRLQRLVESLLDFGRMEAGAQPYRIQKLDAAELVRSVVEDFRRDAVARGYSIELRSDTGAVAVDADPEALTCALWNLLDNAVKYSPNEHTVAVELARQDGSVAIRVCDRGIGIPRDEQKRIFRKFVRGTASKVNGIKGTGVGLALVEHIVSAHGGTIDLQSRPGEGSTFTLLFPAT